MAPFQAYYPIAKRWRTKWIFTACSTYDHTHHNATHSNVAKHPVILGGLMHQHGLAHQLTTNNSSYLLGAKLSSTTALRPNSAPLWYRASDENWRHPIWSGQLPPANVGSVLELLVGSIFTGLSRIGLSPCGFNTKAGERTVHLCRKWVNTWKT